MLVVAGSLGAERPHAPSVPGAGAEEGLQRRDSAWFPLGRVPQEDVDKIKDEFIDDPRIPGWMRTLLRSKHFDVNVKLEVKLWPGGRVRYFIHDNVRSNSRLHAAVAGAVSHWNASEFYTGVRFVEMSGWSLSERDGGIVLISRQESRTGEPASAVPLMHFDWDIKNFDDGTAFRLADWFGPDLFGTDAKLPEKGYMSMVFLDDRVTRMEIQTATDVVAHELGHVVGLMHEHQRWDAGRFVRATPRILRNPNIEATNFSFLDLTGVPGRPDPYDYGSSMHYDGHWSVPPGIPIPSAGLSYGDKRGVGWLYNRANSFRYPRITTNPRGLEVVVNGQTVDTPHEIDVPSITVQVPLVQYRTGDECLSSIGKRFQSLYSSASSKLSCRYLFGNWGGSGSLGSRPGEIHVRSVARQVWLQANFIVQVSRDGSNYRTPWMEFSSPGKLEQVPPELYRDRIAAWPQALLFVASKDKEFEDQVFRLANFSGGPQRYYLVATGAVVLQKTSDPSAVVQRHGPYKTVALQQIDNGEIVDVHISEAPNQDGYVGAREAGQYEGRVSVCELIDFSSVEPHHYRRCLDIPARLIVVPQDPVSWVR